LNNHQQTKVFPKLQKAVRKKTQPFFLFKNMETELFDFATITGRTGNQHEDHQRTHDWFMARLGRITASNFDKIAFFENRKYGANKAEILAWAAANCENELYAAMAAKGVETPEKLTINEIKTVCDSVPVPLSLTKGTETYLCSLLAQCAIQDVEWYLLQKEIETQHTNKPCRYGIETEPLAFAEYKNWLAANHQLEAEPAGFQISNWSNLVGGSPDGVARLHGKIHRILEIKCPYNGGNHIENLKRGTIAEQYYYQLIGNMLVTGAEYGDFVTYDPRCTTHLQFAVFTINRQQVQEEIDALLHNLKDFEKIYLAEAKKMDLKIPSL
jgi:hypothetical protein